MLDSFREPKFLLKNLQETIIFLKIFQSKGWLLLFLLICIKHKNATAWFLFNSWLEIQEDREIC